MTAVQYKSFVGVFICVLFAAAEEQDDRNDQVDTIQMIVRELPVLFSTLQHMGRIIEEIIQTDLKISIEQCYFYMFFT